MSLGPAFSRGSSAHAGIVGTVNADALRARAEAIDWWHCIDLGQGVVTNGQDPTRWKLGQIQMPADLTGWSVLDIGAWDGFFSFEAEKRGAERVLAVDREQWGWSRDGFELAHEALNSKVETQVLEVIDVTEQTVGQFDLVLFLGLLYHMRHPMLVLEQLRRVTKRLLILETHVDMLSVRRPAFAFYPGGGGPEGKVGPNNPSDWIGPNPAGVIAMLQSAEFSSAAMVAKPAALPRRVAASVRARRFNKTWHSSRATFHARP